MASVTLFLVTKLLGCHSRLFPGQTPLNLSTDRNATFSACFCRLGSHPGITTTVFMVLVPYPHSLTHPAPHSFPRNLYSSSSPADSSVDKRGSCPSISPQECSLLRVFAPGGPIQIYIHTFSSPTDICSGGFLCAWLVTLLTLQFLSGSLWTFSCQSPVSLHRLPQCLSYCLSLHLPSPFSIFSNRV